MPARRFSTDFDPAAIALLAQAYGEAIAALHLPPLPAGRTSPHHAVARRIMVLAAQGERSPAILREAGVAMLRLS